VAVVGRTRTFIESTGSQAIRGLQESLMASRVRGTSFSEEAADEETASTLLFYTFQPTVLTRVLIHNFSGVTWGNEDSTLEIGYFTHAGFLAGGEPVETLAYVTEFDGAGGVPPLTGIDMSDDAQLATLGADYSPLRPVVIPPGHYVTAFFDNNEGAGAVLIYSLWEAACTPERVLLTPASPAVAALEVDGGALI
jgi:hypothetical protein